MVGLIALIIVILDQLTKQFVKVYLTTPRHRDRQFLYLEQTQHGGLETSCTVPEFTSYRHFGHRGHRPVLDDQKTGRLDPPVPVLYQAGRSAV